MNVNFQEGRQKEVFFVILRGPTGGHLLRLLPGGRGDEQHDAGVGHPLPDSEPGGAGEGRARSEGAPRVEAAHAGRPGQVGRLIGYGMPVARGKAAKNL